MELTMRNLREEGGEVDRSDFLARADMLAASGKTVLISDYFEYYRLAAYLGQYTKKQDRHHDGRVEPARAVRREVLRRARGRHPRVVRPPVQERPAALHLPACSIRPPAIAGDRRQPRGAPPELRKLYGYLVDSGYIRQLENVNRDYLPIFSRDALRKIKVGDSTWEAMVPIEVAEVIKRRRFFGYRPTEPTNGSAAT